MQKNLQRRVKKENGCKSTILFHIRIGCKLSITYLALQKDQNPHRYKKDVVYHDELPFLMTCTLSRVSMMYIDETGFTNLRLMMTRTLTSLKMSSQKKKELKRESKLCMCSLELTLLTVTFDSMERGYTAIKEMEYIMPNFIKRVGEEGGQALIVEVACVVHFH